MTEIRKFAAKVKIRDEDGSIKELKQDFDLMIPFDKKAKEKSIRFEKDGKNYDFIINYTIKKGLFKDTVTSYGFRPLPESRYEIYLEDDNEKSSREIKPLYTRATGPLIILFFVLGIFAIDAIYILYQRKNKEGVNWSKIIGFSFLAILALIFALLLWEKFE